jgi:hypothetical protein
VLNEVKKDCQQQLAYYNTLPENYLGGYLLYEKETAEQLKKKIEDTFLEDSKK